MNLSPWELELPIAGASGSIEIIPPEQLVSYSSQYFEPQLDGSVVFMCPTNGVTTPNSDYPRTELRQVNTWAMGDSSTLIGELSVNKLAGGKGIIFAQIHGTDNTLNPQLFKLYFTPD